MPTSHQLSVVIPAYNRAGILPEAIESVLSQGHHEIQVVVVDDGSTDETPALASRYDSRVLWIRQENHGQSHARNRGFQQSNGELVAFLDSDDLLLPQRVATDRRLFAEFPSADVVVTDCELWMENQLSCASLLRDRLSRNGWPLAMDGPEFVPESSEYWLKGKHFATCTMTFRRSALQRLGPQVFDDRLRCFEDWDLEIRMLRCCRVLVTQQVLSKVRLFDDGTRIDRPAMRRPPTPRQYRLKLEWQIYVVEKTIAAGGWKPEIVQALSTRREELNLLLASRAAEEHTGAGAAIPS